MLAERGERLDEAVTLPAARAQDRARESVVSRQPGLGVFPAGQARPRGQPADRSGRQAADQLGRPGPPRRSALQAAALRRRRRGLGAGARRGRRVDRSRRKSRARSARLEAGCESQDLACSWPSSASPSASCAPRLVALPSGAGTPFPDSRRLRAGTDACRDVRTMAAVLSISGRAAGQRFRAKIDAGFEAPARVRLEFPAPRQTVLHLRRDGDDRRRSYFPRDGRVLRDAPPAAIARSARRRGPRSRRTADDRCRAAAVGGRQPRADAFAALGGASIPAARRRWLAADRGAWRIVAASGRTRRAYGCATTDFVGGRPSRPIRLRRLPRGQRAARPI